MPSRFLALDAVDPPYLVTEEVVEVVTALGDVPHATVVMTDALGHGSVGDPKPDWHRLYS